MISRYELFTASIASVYHDIQKIERTEMAQFGLKGPHAQCLLNMSHFPEGITASRLCDICEKDKAAISRTLGELEKMELVSRETTNGNRYRARLMLTERGRQVAESVNKKAQQAVELAGAGLDDAQREVFYRVLGQIAGNLHNICKDGLK